MDNTGTFKSALTQSFKGIKETKAAALTTCRRDITSR